MPLMSIIGCMEFEKEIAELLAEDKEINQLLVVGNSKSAEFLSDLEKRGLKPEVLLPETLPPGLKKKKGFNVLVTLHDISMYKSPQHMKREAYEKIKFYGLVSKGVLMLYGSCEGIFGDTLLDFRNSKFFLELLTSDDDRFIGDNIDACISGKNKDVHSPELADKISKCYHKLKEQILSSGAN